MKALITGASSGLGRELARQLSVMGYDIIAVARRYERLEALADEISTKVTPIVCDLSAREECFALYEKVKDEDIDIVINNAGFGLLGDFSETELSRELEMTEVNICALHILTKLFLKKFKQENKGYILNVSSVGAYLPGSLISSYYATKSYVKSLTLAVREEVQQSGCDVYVGCLCPGPIDTEFSDVAMAKSRIKARSSEYVAKRALHGMFKKRAVIAPGLDTKLSILASRILPESFMARLTYKIQQKKLR